MTLTQQADRSNRRWQVGGPANCTRRGGAWRSARNDQAIGWRFLRGV